MWWSHYIIKLLATLLGPSSYPTTYYLTDYVLEGKEKVPSPCENQLNESGEGEREREDGLGTKAIKLHELELIY